MIKCEMIENISNDPDEICFNLDIKGYNAQVLIEMVRIIGEFVIGYRDIGIDEADIEKQLVLCVKGGFDFADGKMQKRRNE